MEADSLCSSLEHVAGSGWTLTIEERTALQTSLVILRQSNQFERVLFWGKILGIHNDYYIAQGRGKNELTDKKTLYSMNCLDWLLLPEVTDSMIEDVTKAASGRFTGDPSFVYENISRAEDFEDEVFKVNEEKRLAVVINQIEDEVSVVPRGAYMKSPRGVVHLNRSFTGLSSAEAKKLENFMHFREPKVVRSRIALGRAEWSPPIDFLDPLSDDIPKGAWSLQIESGRKVCVLRSLLWMGLTFYHVQGTPQHGYLYIGLGMRNLDLPFML